jgi:hypothetical protein
MTEHEATESPDLYSQSVDLFLVAHLKVIEGKIRAHATQFAKDDGSDGQVQPMHVAAAARLYAPGYPIFEWTMGSGGATESEEGSRPEVETTPSEERAEGLSKQFGRMILSSITGVTIISGILAIVFGLIGYFVGIRGDVTSVQGFIDVAQIFAGAVVGSTGAATFGGGGAASTAQ